jgi:RNA polymerase sigma-70 factor (ECF subfamily)
MSAAAPTTDWEGLEDIELIEEAARGEVDALSALYDRFSGLLLTMAIRMLGDRAMAEDLVHDVFMEVWRNANRYDPSRGSVRTWVLVRLRSRALDRLRSATARREVASDDIAPREAAPEHEDPSLAPDRAALVACLAQLPDEQRLVLELSYFQGLSSSEIAQRMGTPLGTVKSRTAAALAKLRSAMESPRGRPS